jgi:hypothetical protein
LNLRKFLALRAVNMKMAVFWIVALCSLVEVHNISKVLAASITVLIMEAASTFEISASYSATIQKMAFFTK